MKSDCLASVFGAALVAVSPFPCVLAQQPGPASCESLAKFHASDATITGAVSIEATAKITNGATASKAFCRISGYLTPTSDSHIQFEVWMPPVAEWNHKFQGAGNGGFAGSVNYRAMLPALERGYAAKTADDERVAPPGNPVWAGLTMSSFDLSEVTTRTTMLANAQLV